MTEQTTEQMHWTERAREGLKKTTEFVAEHGATVGMSGGAILVMGAGACALMGNVAPDGAIATEWYSDGAKTLFGAMAAIGGSLVVEEAARQLLGKDNLDQQFGSTQRSIGHSPLKGAVKIEDDPSFSPRFFNVLRETLKSLEQDPESKASLVSVLKASPDARMAFAKTMSESAVSSGQLSELTRAVSDSISNPKDGTEPAPG